MYECLSPFTAFLGQATQTETRHGSPEVLTSLLLSASQNFLQPELFSSKEDLLLSTLFLHISFVCQEDQVALCGLDVPPGYEEKLRSWVWQDYILPTHTISPQEIVGRSKSIKGFLLLSSLLFYPKKTCSWLSSWWAFFASHWSQLIGFTAS